MHKSGRAESEQLLRPFYSFSVPRIKVPGGMHIRGYFPVQGMMRGLRACAVRTSMSLILLYPPGQLYPHYRSAENALDFAKRLHERQLALRTAHADWYDPDVHAIVIVFNLRIIGRKLDALASSFQTSIKTGQVGGLSARTISLQAALREFNASVACRDATDNTVEAAGNVLDMAFDYLASLASDIQRFELQN